MLVNRVLGEVNLGRDHPLEVTIAFVQATVDRAHLERIVENLLGSARQHVAPGIPIWVTVAPCTGGMVLSVDDAGPGVPPEIGGRNFEPSGAVTRPSGRASALACPSLPGSPSCTVAGRGPRNGRAAERRSGCSCLGGVLRITPGSGRVTPGA
jgi:two-component system OmpR family sensor kinase